MSEIRDDQFLWCEKYRPQKIDDCVLPESLKKTFKEYVSKGQLPTFLFCGTAGVGKSTVAKALCAEVGADWINQAESGSSNRRIIRTTELFLETANIKDIVVLIGWSTWEREEWWHEGKDYQVTASGTDDVPDALKEKYKQWIVNLDYNKKKIDATVDIWAFDRWLRDHDIKVCYFNTFVPH